MSLSLFNSLGNRKETFTSIEPGIVKMYVCGPTVWDYAHIGNLRSFLTADVLRRTLEAEDYDVRQVMNITDVGHMTVDDLRDTGEDKLEAAAKRVGKDPMDLARFYTEAFFDDLESLNFRRAAVYPRATETIPEMIELVERLIAKGNAYEVEGNVYFDVSSFPAYGALSGNTVESLKAGARIEVLEEKRHPEDFALWKRDEKHAMQWESPWGRGFPGWHLECSVMAMANLGETIDIHTGGEDNKFPHHECEIAQSEAATGKPFVRFFVHTRHLLVEGAKMAKSEGNFFTLRDLTEERGLDPMAVRLALMGVHYRQPMNFTIESVEEAAKNLDRIRDLLRRLGPSDSAPERPEVAAAVDGAARAFRDAMDDDLNVSPARAAVLGLVTELNRIGAPFAPGDAVRIETAFEGFDAVLGLNLVSEDRGPSELDAWARGKLEEREQARSRRDFAAADRIREELAARGLVVEDTPDGPIVRRS